MERLFLDSICKSHCRIENLFYSHIFLLCHPGNLGCHSERVKALFRHISSRYNYFCNEITKRSLTRYQAEENPKVQKTTAIFEALQMVIITNIVSLVIRCNLLNCDHMKIQLLFQKGNKDN